MVCLELGPPRQSRSYLCWTKRRLDLRCWAVSAAFAALRCLLARQPGWSNCKPPPVCLWWPDHRGFRQGSRPIYRLSVEEDPALARAAIDAFKKFKIHGHL